MFSNVRLCFYFSISLKKSEIKRESVNDLRAQLNQRQSCDGERKGINERARDRESEKGKQRE